MEKLSKTEAEIKNMLLYKKSVYFKSIKFEIFTSKKEWFEKQSSGGVLLKKGVLRNSAKFAGNHLCLRLFFDKVASLMACNFVRKREALAQVFSCEFCDIFKNILF